MVAITRISPEFLLDRLDGRYNSPLAVSVRKKIKASGLSTKKITDVFDLICGPFGSTLTADEHVENGEVLLIQPTNISGDTFSEDSSWRITKKDQIAKGLKLYPPGTLLFARVGVYPHTGILPIESGLATISSSMIAGLPKNDVDTHYICAFFKSSHGFQLLLAAQKVTAQPTIGTSEIGGTEIPVPERRVQQYIGDKVRQAERLQAWAKELRADVDVVLDQFNLPTSESPAMVNRVSTTRLDARLDPRPYRTHYITLVDRIKEIENSSVNAVADLASGCPVSSNDFIEAGEVPLVRIRNIGFDEFIDLDTGVTKSLHADEAKYQAKENMIVIGMDGIFRTQFFLNDELPMLVNQRVAMLTANDIRAELLTHWLNRPEGQMQLNQWAVKTTVEHTSLSDIGRVLIPRLGRNAEDGLAEKLLSARQAYRYSRFLTTCAMFLVEALIEGQLTEADLIVAEQALQAGNDQPDRRILNRLRTDGVDGQGQPLFSDLDQLYSLLEQASQS